MSSEANSKLNSSFFLLLLQFTVVFSGGPTTDYCTIKCGRDTHTVCDRRHRCGPIKGCSPMENTVAFREHMVKVHNEFRNKIASGQDGSQYNNKGAKNMMAVSYDMELEYVAQCWANMCKTLTHDKCRSVKRFLSGQNIFWGLNNNETEKGVADWYNEIAYMTNPTWIDKFNQRNYPDDNKQRGHFTQLVWGTSKLIGCARVRYGRNNMETQLICNYGPAGNMVDGNIYKMAADASQIASECPGGKNDKYTSLCGKIDPIPTEKCWAGVGRSGSNILLVPICVLFGYLGFSFLFV